MIHSTVTRWFRRNRKAAHDLGARVSVGRCFSGPTDRTKLKGIELILYRDDGYWMQVIFTPQEASVLAHQMLVLGKEKT